jgi:hypothetical protein
MTKEKATPPEERLLFNGEWYEWLSDLETELEPLEVTKVRVFREVDPVYAVLAFGSDTNDSQDPGGYEIETFATEKEATEWSDAWAKE